MLDKETCLFDETVQFIRNCKHCCSAASYGCGIFQSIPCCLLSTTSTYPQVHTCSLWNAGCASCASNSASISKSSCAKIVSFPILNCFCAALSIDLWCSTFGAILTCKLLCGPWRNQKQIKLFCGSTLNKFDIIVLLLRIASIVLVLRKWKLHFQGDWSSALSSGEHAVVEKWLSF